MDLGSIREMDDSVIKDSSVEFEASQGTRMRGILLRISRHHVVFELYNPAAVLRLSETLSDFKVILNELEVYSGRATLTSVVNTGLAVVCEAGLAEGVSDMNLPANLPLHGGLGKAFQSFYRSWRSGYHILPEYKLVISDMQYLLSDLQRWLEQVELGIRSAPAGDRLQLEREIASQLGPEVSACVNGIWERFEPIAKRIEPEAEPAHRAFLQRQLHPWLLCSPFAYRTFHKPLGYAGDYEMVNMILREPFEGSSLYSKMVNVWLLQQPPAEGHRNRVEYLQQQLQAEVLRVCGQNRPARIFNLGCGPAVEIQRFLKNSELSNHAQFTLLDFNDETLRHAEAMIQQNKIAHRRSTEVSFVRKSVQQLLKEAGKQPLKAPEQMYDFIYCAGLFDYLSTTVCQRILSILYRSLAPGGLLLATNVDAAKPFHISMEYILDWHLICRSGPAIG